MTDTLATATPLRYDPALETPEPDEAETIAQMVATLQDIGRITFRDEGRALRAVHAKGHGLLQGRLAVLGELPPELAQGLFAQTGRSFDAVIRLSTAPSDLLADSVSTPRGFALKVLDVPGEQLSGRASDRTQDFVLVNGEAFSASSAKAFLRGLKLLAVSTDRVPKLKAVASKVMQVAERALEAVGHESPTVRGLGGQPETDILGETFFSVAAIRHGDHVAKVRVVPRSANLRSRTGAPIDTREHPDALRECVVAFFAEQEAAEWDVQVQLNTDVAAMPIEDLTVVWPEALSPYRTVARLHVPRQAAWSEGRVHAVEQGMSFSPWHGLVLHRPLGAVMRVRRAAYEASVALRAEHRGTVVQEPRHPVALPD